MALAIELFPGGNRFEPGAPGYSFLDNFWCDLFDEKSYAGIVNDGRSYAIVASVILFIAMIPLWWELPKGFVRTPRIARLTQVCGSLGMLGATLVPTPWHDRAIDLAGPLGGAAYILMLAGLWCNGRRRLALLGLTPLALSTANFVMWAGHIAIRAMPAVQKAAFIAFVAWTCALAVAEIKLNRQDGSSAL
jgi:hypothetical protein